MDIVIRARTSYRSILMRPLAGTLAMAVNADVFAAVAIPQVTIVISNIVGVIGSFFFRVTEDSELRITEDGEQREVNH